MSIFTRRKDAQITELKALVERQVKTIEDLDTFAKSITMTDPVLSSIFKWQDANKKGPELKTPYTQIPAIHACIKWKARNFAQVPFRIYRGDNLVERGPIVDLFNEINPTLDPFQFWEGLSTSLDYNGNAYIIKDEEVRYGLPVYLWLFNPGWITPAYDRSGVWVGWWLKRGGTGQGEFLDFSRVIQLKYYNPDHEILGLSPLEVLRVTGDTMWKAGLYNKNFFDNDATPSTVYVHPDKIQKRKREELEKDLIEDRKGVENSSRAQMLTGGWDIKAVGLSQKDIQFLELIKLSREDISMVYGVPKKIMGLYEDINMATAESAEKQFWEDTIMPIASMMKRAINKSLLTPLGYEGRFDFSGISVLNALTTDKVASAVTLFNTRQFTMNEINRRLGLGFDEVPERDAIPVEADPFASPDPGKSAKNVTPTIPMRVIEEQKPISLDAAHLADKWAKDITPLLPVMSKAAKDVRDYFHRVEQTIIRSLTKRAAGQYTMKMAIDEVPEDEVVRAFSDDELFTAIEPHVKDAMTRGIQTIVRTSFTMDNAGAVTILGAKRIKVIEMNNSAKTQVVESLRQVLKDGLAEGIGQDEMARRIIESLTGQMDQIKRRAKTIARTEINNGFSEARWAAVEEDPPKYVRWISSRDAKVRDSHAYLDGQVVPYGELFPNGCKFPHDPNGAADEVINCRCTWEPVYLDEE